MASVESLVRAALREWVTDRPWSIPPTVTTDAPTAGDELALPTLTCWFDRVDVANATPREVSPGVFETGQAEAAVTFLFRCTSELQADTFRQEWRDLMWVAAMDASPTGLAPVLPFQIEVGPYACKSYGCKLYLDGSLELAPVEDPQVQGIWLVRASGRLAYPALAVREPTALMTCSVRIAGTEYQAATFQAPCVLSINPADNSEIELDDPAEVIFDQPMSPLELDGYVVTAGEGMQAFAILPLAGWQTGLNTLTIPGDVRSAKGIRMDTDYTLSLFGVTP